MGTKRTDEFRADAVRIALTSGLTRKQVASDLGVGLSTLNIEHVQRHWSERTCERSRRIATLTLYPTMTWNLPVRMSGFGGRTAFSGRRGRS